MECKKIKKNIKSITVIGATIATFLIVLFLLLPSAKKIKTLNFNTYQQRVALEKLFIRGKSLKKAKENYEAVKKQISLLEEVYIKEGSEIDFITRLEDIAKKSDVEQVLNINKDELDKKSKDKYKTVNININLKGEYKQILTYLDKLQQEDYYVNIYYLKLNNPKATKFSEKEKKYVHIKDGENPEINAVISAKTYWKINQK